MDFLKETTNGTDFFEEAASLTDPFGKTAVWTDPFGEATVQGDVELFNSLQPLLIPTRRIVEP